MAGVADLRGMDRGERGDRRGGNHVESDAEERRGGRLVYQPLIAGDDGPRDGSEPLE